MQTHHKAIAIFGLVQLSVEYLEEVMADPRFSKAFIRELKRDSNNLIKSSDKFISYISKDGDTNTKEQIVDVYKVISRLVEDGIDWETRE